LPVPKPDCIELPTGEKIPILHENRAVIAIDKPRGWMLVPFSWQQTRRNLQAALVSSIAAGDFWARSRNLKFLRFVHRLDADTTGILLLARSQGALATYSRLFESRRMEKVYLAVVRGAPGQKEWICRLPLAPDPRQHGRMKVDHHHGKESETLFRTLQTVAAPSKPIRPPAPKPLPTRSLRGKEPATPAVEFAEKNRFEPLTLVEAHPYTGRTHQIRIHLAQSGHPIVGDELYGPVQDRGQPLALRAIRLDYTDPFTKRREHIHAPTETFCREYGFTTHALTRDMKRES
jgi:23S rRNA pseudouridine1911/1915/1917 synthase